MPARSVQQTGFHRWAFLAGTGSGVHTSPHRVPISQPMPGSIIGLGMGLGNIYQQLHLCKSLSFNRGFPASARLALYDPTVPAGRDFLARSRTPSFILPHPMTNMQPFGNGQGSGATLQP
jgi:hypothetical protein